MSALACGPVRPRLTAPDRRIIRRLVVDGPASADEMNAGGRAGPTVLRHMERLASAGLICDTGIRRPVSSLSSERACIVWRAAFAPCLRALCEATS